MSFTLFDAPYPENSSRVGFSGSQLERLSEKRDEASIKQAMTDARALILIAGHGLVLLKLMDDAPSLIWLTFQEAEALGGVVNEPVLLGYEADGAPRFACFSELDRDTPPSGYSIIDYRSLYIAGLLQDHDLGALAQGAALVAWHQSHQFCSRCGTKSQPTEGGYKRVCPSCGAQHFPRTDPVVIMLVVSSDSNSVLLGRSPHFPEGMYSCLAGFVEPGETIENAVRRETIEETGIKVGRVAYHASQPWPFPYSLMIGMYGEATNEAIKLDDELDDARWFKRDDVWQMAEGNHPDGTKMPPKGAIAWRLVEDWLRS